MISKLRHNLGLADAARLRTAIANMADEAGRMSSGDPAVAQVLGKIGQLIDQVDSSLARYEAGTIALPRDGVAAADDLHTVNRRIQRELCAGSQALETLHQAFSGRLRVNAPRSVEGFRYRVEPQSRQHDAAPSPGDRALGMIPNSSWDVHAAAAADALFVCDVAPDGKLERLVEVNEAACHLLGYARDELLGLSLADIDGSADGGDAHRIAADVLAGRSVVLESAQRAKDGRLVPVEIHAHGLGATDRPVLVALARDLGRQEVADEKLRLWQKAFEASADAIVITDADERILSVNRAVTEITGYTAEEVIGKTPRVFHSGRQDKDFYRSMWATILSTGHWQGEIWDRRKNGEIYPKWLTISAVPDHSGRVTHYIASFSDITSRKNYEEQIQFLAYHDSLTGLPNRRRLKERFEVDAAHARRNGCKLHLLFIDLDHFKNINDTLGHAVGDKFLQGITARLKNCLRNTDILSRLGGDEFVIVLSDTHGVVDLPHIMGKLAASMAVPLDIEGHALKPSASIGIGIFPDDGEDFETLLHKADTAMYQAKQQGRGNYLYFDAGMNAAAQERIVMQSHLRGALEQGEIFLHYQPRAHIGFRRIAGVEAMLRWESPILGSVDPERFVPLAEDCGLMSQICEWALREVCRQAGAWHATGWSNLTVSLKLMPAHYRRNDLVEVLGRALAESGVAPGCIELGFSEAGMIQGKDAILDTARRLKELGVALFLDGYGSGYSSLSFLKRCNVDRVKLDRTLVASLPDNRDNADIVRAAIQTANCLGLGVIADGIASEAQIALLHEAGCDLGQGPLFGHPQSDPLPLQWN